MRIPYFLILTACTVATNGYAETPRLPPVLDNSTYSDTIPENYPPQLPTPQLSTPQLPTPGYEETNNLDKLQTDVSVLKSKVQEQEEAINNLRRANAEIQKKLVDSSKNPVFAAKVPVLSTIRSASSTKSLPSAGSEKEHYQRGTALLKKGDYHQAQQEFQEILKTYPTGRYADNAQYWLGVALLNKGDKKAAMQAFDRVARVYPKSEKAPEALFKLGDTLLHMKNKAKAREYFDYVIQNYPGTNGAALAAKKKAQAKL